MGKEKGFIKPQADGSILCDLDMIIPPKRVWKITGKMDKTTHEVDVTNLPSRVTLEVAQNEEKMAQLSKSGDAELMTMLFDLTIKICKPSFPEISLDWLLDNTETKQLMALTAFTLEPLYEYMEKASLEAKKVLAAQVKQPRRK